MHMIYTLITSKWTYREHNFMSVMIKCLIWCSFCYEKYAYHYHDYLYVFSFSFFQECSVLNIAFHLLIGQAKDKLSELVREADIGVVVTDFCPLRVPTQWVKDVKGRLPSHIPFCQVVYASTCTQLCVLGHSILVSRKKSFTYSKYMGVTVFGLWKNNFWWNILHTESNKGGNVAIPWRRQRDSAENSRTFPP